jgi:hypothetical protein
MATVKDFIEKFNANNSDYRKDYLRTLFNELTSEYNSTINPDCTTDYQMPADDYELYCLLSTSEEFAQELQFTAMLSADNHMVTIRITSSKGTMDREYLPAYLDYWKSLHDYQDKATDSELPF